MGKMNLVSGNLFWERHCSARKDLRDVYVRVCVFVVVAGYALTILRRCYGVSVCCIVVKIEVDGGSPVSEAVGDNDG